MYLRNASKRLKRKESHSEKTDNNQNEESIQMQSSFHHRPGAILFARCRLGLYYVSKILAVDTVRQRCYMKFNDGKTHWCKFSDIQKTDIIAESAAHCSLCYIDSPDDTVVICSKCQLGYHSRCHNPVVSSHDHGWICQICVQRTSNQQEKLLPLNDENISERRSNGRMKRTLSGKSSNEVCGSCEDGKKVTSNNAERITEAGGLSISEAASTSKRENSAICQKVDEDPKVFSPGRLKSQPNVSMQRFLRTIRRRNPNYLLKRKCVSKRKRQELAVPDVTSYLTHPRNVVETEVVEGCSSREVPIVQLESSMNNHFGAKSRFAVGQYSRVLARRTTPDKRVQYLVQWEGGHFN